ncbi:MAG: SUMF1/EgtB/PvdO family nonheme iron enzyme [Bacteroidales bacterium]|jgi:gliding motility-associated lipoprotein GldK|nr:SUMF1/EgtB/PvdO family nonheme iron enzyme [Bacteroidales bacterium]
MKKMFLLLSAALFMFGCSSSDNGELVGVQDRPATNDVQPYGMVAIPQGNFMMGTGDEDPFHTNNVQPKSVQIAAFYMDETEITNNKYRQFVYWVRDSIAMRMLGEINPDRFLIATDQYGEDLETPRLNWKARKYINFSSENEEEREALEALFVPVDERYYGKKQIDITKLNYEYYYWNLDMAAQKNLTAGSIPEEYKGSPLAGRPVNNRKALLKKDVINIYPDTLSWMHDYVGSYNEPLTRSYFAAPEYDDYPVVGVTYKQAKAFSIWRTLLMNNKLDEKEMSNVSEFRLPTEAEWEYAAKGGSINSPYPWGGPYVQNGRGCFIANYKPRRGAYDLDGGYTPIICGHFAPNDFGLYDMAGNVAEWCDDAFNESGYKLTNDMASSYRFAPGDTDELASTRKVVRGGSWKDIKYYIQTGTRSWEYQDTAKCYIGFRCVQSFLGRNQGDNPKTSSNVYRH